MSMPAEIDRLVQKTSDDDSAKRRQIIEGAQRVFLAQGFDAASMGEIARAAGVSKGTLYVYFENKEQLFQSIVAEQCKTQAEAIFAFDPSDRDIESALTRLGTDYVKFLIQPERISPLRTVIGITERMPEIGRQFYEAGPACGIANSLRISAPRSMPACSRSTTAKSQRRSSWTPASRRCSSRSCSVSALPRRRSGIHTWSELRCGSSSPPIAGAEALREKSVSCPDRRCPALPSAMPWCAGRRRDCAKAAVTAACGAARPSR